MRRPVLKIISVASFVLAIAAAASPAAAQNDGPRYVSPGDQFYRKPAERLHGLRFADLEAGMPTDPLSWSSDPGWKLHRTPDAQLEDATDQLRAAIPAGTSVAAALAILQHAGAQCGAGNPGQVMCRYRDAETPYAGQYFDDVLWRVWLDVDGGQVGKLVVTRDWSRQ